MFQGGAPQAYSSVAHDGHNLWAGGYTEETIRVYDDGVFEAYWLTWDPQEGTIPPGDEVEVIVTLNAIGLNSGDYEAAIHILSNDPANSDAVVGIIFHVIGVPNIYVEWPEVAGFPDSLDFNAYYVDLFAGGPYSIPLTITNVGTDELVVDQISCDNDAFRVSPVEFRLTPGEDAEVNLVFESNRPMTVNSHLTIASNDPDEEEIVVSLHAASLNPPRIRVTPDQIELEEPDPNTPIFIRVQNEGESPLRWDSEFEIISESGSVIGHSKRGSEVRELSNSARDEAGEILAYYTLDHGSATSFDFDPNAQWMWTAHLDPSHITAYEVTGDYDETHVVFDRRLTDHSSAVAFLDGQIYTNNRSDSAIYSFNQDGQLTRTIPLGFFPVDLASSPKSMRLFALDNQKQIHIYDPRRDYTEVGFYSIREACAGRDVGSICWVDKHRSSELWASGENQVWNFSPQLNGEVQHAQSFRVRSDNMLNGLGHDDQNIWVAEQYAGVRVGIYDDGVYEMWLELNPSEGTLDPGRWINLVLSFDPNLTRFFDGEYEADLHFLSNDPVDPHMQVSIRIRWLDAPKDPTDLLPAEVTLNGAYPNPFNSSTTISYSLPTRETVRMAIYDQTGRKVVSQIEGEVLPGEHRLSWNAESNPAGIYFCRLEAKREQRAVKLVVVK